MTATITDVPQSDVIHLKSPVVINFSEDGGADGVEHGGWPRKRLPAPSVEQVDIIEVPDDEDIIDEAQFDEDAASAYGLYMRCVELLHAHTRLEGISASEFIDQFADYANHVIRFQSSCSYIEEDTAFHDVFAEVLPDDTVVNEPGTPGYELQRLVIPPNLFERGFRVVHSKAPRDGRSHCSMHATMAGRYC